ncbi:MAG TPA: hypothetical protein VGJ21_01530 [Terracidiphilus sp.]|jgi:hypothetical protein
MSAAVQFPNLALATAGERRLHVAGRADQRLNLAASASPVKPPRNDSDSKPRFNPASDYPRAPVNSLAFYRKQTERMLRRYLAASMLVGRAPAILAEPVVRGWASYRKVETFEDCVIFVLDMEKCLEKLSQLDRVLLKRVVLQEYSLAETGLLLNRGERFIRERFGQAVDHLTEILLETRILKIPRRGETEADSEFDE